MFMRSIFTVFFIAAALANPIAVPRKEDAATQKLQVKKVTDSGLLDLLNKNNLTAQVNGMSSTQLLHKIVQSKQFKHLKKQTDKKHKNKGKKIGTDDISQATSTGLLDKFKHIGGKNTQDKLNHMSAHQLIIKIAQSEAFKKMKWQEDYEKQHANKKAKVKVIVHKNKKGTPQYTVITRVGGPAVTLAAQKAKVKTTTVISGTTYTINPVTTSTQTIVPDSAASPMAPLPFSLSSSAVAKLFVLLGGAFGGALLVL